MWELFAQLFKKVLKKTLKVPKPIKALRTIKKAPKKFFKRRITKPIRSVKGKIRKAKKLGRLTRFALSPKARAIERTTTNALMMNSINEEINLKLVKRTSAVRSTSELVKQISEGREVLKGLKTDEINKLNEGILKELKGVGVDSQKKMVANIESEEAKEEIVKIASYETFMDNWKDGFYGYKPEELGMSEDERDIVWGQILEDQTPDKVVARKFAD